MFKNAEYYINTAKNLKREYLFIFPNVLRLLGTATQNKAFVGPLKITIDITNKCDMRCAMCWYHSPHIKEETNALNELSPEKFRLLAKEFKNLKVKTIMFTAEGEPFMNSKILKIIEAARSNSLQVEIMTNAYYLDKEKIRFLIDIGIKKIIVSLHCGDAKTFQRIRPLKDKHDFKRIVKNLLLLKYLKGSKKLPLLFITNVISNLNYGNIYEMAKLAEKVGADKILFKPLRLNSDLAKDLKLTLLNKEKLTIDLKVLLLKTNIANNIIDYIKTLKYDRTITAETFSGSQPESGSQKIKICYMPWVHSVIGIDGKVIGCVYSKKQPLGDIYNSSFADIWYGKKYKLFRKGNSCPQKCLGRAVYPLLP